MNLNIPTDRRNIKQNKNETKERQKKEHFKGGKEEEKFERRKEERKKENGNRGRTKGGNSFRMLDFPQRFPVFSFNCLQCVFLFL